ncbi:MAG: peptidylprolyl isomerase [Candidatus Bathyarchaeota archaeon]|nr:peptidylprolyl isomerase [Candidatus Bathyarchaeota archaeon]
MFLTGTKVEDLVVMETSKGVIEIQLNRQKAPLTVENFVTYVESGFFDGTVFHRVIKDFMIQGGGFTVEAEAKEGNAAIPNEGRNGLNNERGTIAMARTNDPNSATSQFFINTVDNAGLDYPNPDGYGYAVFGKVVKGIDVIDAIENVETGIKNTPIGGMADWPTEDVVIIRAYMKEN